MAEANYNELSQIQGFDSLSDTIKNLFKNACSQSEQKSIHFSTYDANNLYCDNAFDCPDFPKILKFFDDVSIDVSYTSKVFSPLFNTISKLKEKELPNLQISLIFYGIKEIGTQFEKNKNINSIDIGSSVTSIKPDAFYGCTSLKQVTLSPALT